MQVARAGWPARVGGSPVTDTAGDRFHRGAHPGAQRVRGSRRRQRRGGRHRHRGALTTMGFGFPDEIATTRVDAFKKDHPDVKLKVNRGCLRRAAVPLRGRRGQPAGPGLHGPQAHRHVRRARRDPAAGRLHRQAGHRPGEYRPPPASRSRSTAVSTGSRSSTASGGPTSTKAAKDAGVTPEEINLPTGTRCRGLNAKWPRLRRRDLTRFGYRPQAPRVPAPVGQGQRRRHRSPPTAAPPGWTTRRWWRR